MIESMPVKINFKRIDTERIPFVKQVNHAAIRESMQKSKLLMQNNRSLKLRKVMNDSSNFSIENSFCIRSLIAPLNKSQASVKTLSNGNSMTADQSYLPNIERKIEQPDEKLKNLKYLNFLRDITKYRVVDHSTKMIIEKAYPYIKVSKLLKDSKSQPQRLDYFSNTTSARKVIEKIMRQSATSVSPCKRINCN